MDSIVILFISGLLGLFAGMTGPHAAPWFYRALLSLLVPLALLRSAASAARKVVDLFAGSGTFSIPLAEL